MNKKLISLVCAPALFAFVGCSSDVTFTSGIDGTKKVSDVSMDEAKSICEAASETAEEFFEANKDGFCAFGAALTGSLGAGFGGGDAVALCEVALAECKSATPTTETTTCNAEAVAANCSATVAELETCYNDSLDTLSTFFGELAGKSCSELTSESTNVSFDFSNPASCTALAEKCPDLGIGIPSVGTSTAS